MKICASYSEPNAVNTVAEMKEIRLDVFESIPSSIDENTIITLCGKDSSLIPNDFKGLVDVADTGINVPFRTIRSYHDFEKTPTEDEIIKMLESGDQEISKGAFMVSSFTDLHNIYRASSKLERKHLVLGMGETGSVTRIRQKRLGNVFTFGYVTEPTAPGQFSVDKMKELGDYCEIVGILGHPLGHSLSPVMQNAAMESAGINGVYLKFDSPSLDNFADVMREYDIKGMNVTIPYKQAIMNQLDEVTELATKVGAINTIINDRGHLKGTNTDITGIKHAFEVSERNLKDHRKVLILGSGGAARAAAYVSNCAGCETYLLARNKETTSVLSKDMDCHIADSNYVKDYDAIINCTPIGMNGDSDYPINLNDLMSNQSVFDMVYNRKTELVRSAERKGCNIVHGIDMLIGQGAKSFQHWFGKDPDYKVMKEAVL